MIDPTGTKPLSVRLHQPRTGVAQDDSSTRKERRWLSNLYIFCVLTIILVESIPDVLFPSLCHHYLYPLHETAIAPLTSTLGIWQVPWTMFHEPDDRNEAYAAIIHFSNHTQPAQWRSPNWRDMTWIQRARHVRQMDYFEKLVEHDFAWVPLARQLARRHGRDNVEAVELFFLWELVARTPNPKELPFWEPIRELNLIESGREHMYTWVNEEVVGRSEQKSEQPGEQGTKQQTVVKHSVTGRQVGFDHSEFVGADEEEELDGEHEHYYEGGLEIATPIG